MGVTNLSGLSITPANPRGGTAFEITAGTIAIVGNPAVTGNMAVTGSITATQNLAITGGIKGSGNLQISSAANAVCGLKKIVVASAGSGTVANTRVLSSSRILLTPIITTAYPKMAVLAVVNTIASGASFHVKLNRLQTAGTVATASGRVAWFIVNK